MSYLSDSGYFQDRAGSACRVSILSSLTTTLAVFLLLILTNKAIFATDLACSKLSSGKDTIGKNSLVAPSGSDMLVLVSSDGDSFLALAITDTMEQFLCPAFETDPLTHILSVGDGSSKATALADMSNIRSLGLSKYISTMIFTNTMMKPELAANATQLSDVTKFQTTLDANKNEPIFTMSLLTGVASLGMIIYLFGSLIKTLFFECHEVPRSLMIVVLVILATPWLFVVVMMIIQKITGITFRW